MKADPSTCVYRADRCKAYRRRILDISQTVTALHIAPAFSCLEIVDVIYNELMRPYDTFLMSKGHGWLAQAVILEERGLLSLENYCKAGGLGGHPDYGVPGVEASTGSLGHGLGMAVGMAAADRLLGQDRRIYVILGDGEMQEGSVWEAIRLASDFGLTNITACIDANGFSGLDRIDNTKWVRRLESFGWRSAEIDGHNPQMALMTAKALGGLTMLVCNTVKGKGVSYMENVPIWHYRSPNQEEYKKALAEL